MIRSIIGALTMVPAFAAPALGQELPVANDQTVSARSAQDLQSRFEQLQRRSRPHGPVSELRIVPDDQSLFDQSGDGYIRMPARLLLAAQSGPDGGETTDFLLLSALALARNQPLRPPRNVAADVLVGTLAFIGEIAAYRPPDDQLRLQEQEQPAARVLEQRGQHAAALRPAEVNPVVTAMLWTKANGACEARVVAGLWKMAGSEQAGRTSAEAKALLKALGPMRVTPDDQCRPA